MKRNLILVLLLASQYLYSQTEYKIIPKFPENKTYSINKVGGIEPNDKGGLKFNKKIKEVNMKINFSSNKVQLVDYRIRGEALGAF